jgi:hypothetical protein
MNEKELSNEEKEREKIVQAEWERLQPRIDDVDNWNNAYLLFIQSEAKKEIPDISEALKLVHDLDVRRASEEKHNLAKEIKCKAIKEVEELFSGLSSEIPAEKSLDEFLECILESVSERERPQIFKAFLVYFEALELDGQIEFFQPKMTCSEYIAQRAKDRFEFLNNERISGITQNDIMFYFRSWWKSQQPTNIDEINVAKKHNKSVKKEQMLGLLPKSNRSNEGIKKSEWKLRAKEICDISARTFDRFYNELKGEFEVSEAGNIRIKKKTPEKK